MPQIMCRIVKYVGWIVIYIIGNVFLNPEISICNNCFGAEKWIVAKSLQLIQIASSELKEKLFLIVQDIINGIEIVKGLK